MTPKEIQERFHKELKHLLFKYNAQLTIEDKYSGYFSDDKIVVDFDFDETLFEEHGTGIIPQLIIGTYEDGK